MKKTKKVLLSLLMISTMLLPQTIYGAEKIKSISLKFDAEMEDDYGGAPDLDITSKSNKYTVDDYEITNALEDEDDEDIYGGPGALQTTKTQTSKKTTDEVFSCEITLSAADNYVFDTLKKSDIKLSGFDALCTKASRKDSGKTLVLTVELPGVRKGIRNVEAATWESPGVANWTHAKNATTYILRLYKEGNLKGTYETGGTRFDFSPAMLKQGSYYYTVKAMDGENGSKERAESDAVFINDEQVSRNKDRYSLKYDNAIVTAGPSDRTAPINAGWQKEEGRYWYRLDNGMYPQMNWLQLGDDWYFFDKDGYLLTNDSLTWKGKTYSFDNDGRLIN